MKKMLSLVLFVNIISACTTNPYTYEDYEAGKKTCLPVSCIGDSLHPGVSQVIHGEYKEIP